MRIRILILKPELIEYMVFYKVVKTNKIVHIRTLSMMCINRVAVIKETYLFDIDSYQAIFLERRS